MAYTIGLDYGSNAIRALLVNCHDGDEVASSSYHYPSGQEGILLEPTNPHLARQNPADYIQGLETVLKTLLQHAADQPHFSGDQIIGIGVGTTGSTPIPVDASNVPLAMKPEWQQTIAAHAWLWKDHTASREAKHITELAQKIRPQYLAKCGGTYSSEWFWAKIWHCLNTAPEVFDQAYSWVELADFIPSVLAGIHDPLKIKRGVCAAGHKAMYSDTWGGLPDSDFLSKLHPKLGDLRNRLYDTAYNATALAGRLTPEWASRLGLKEGIPIGVGGLDAHYGAIGSGVETGTLVKIIGTSTCDCTVSPNATPLQNVPGISGIVNESILPGHFGLEGGQSAVGDIFKWFVTNICQGNETTHQQLSEAASALHPGQSGLLALDWNNGNRNVLTDPQLTGLLIGQTLYTTQAEIYRALIEATAFGARVIIERLQAFGVPVSRIVCCGGIAEKNALLMQIYADVTGCTMELAHSNESCALGAAIAVAAHEGAEVLGGFVDIAAAQKQIVKPSPKKYEPQAQAKATYDQLFDLYQQLHDSFGGKAPQADLSHIMKALLLLKTPE